MTITFASWHTADSETFEALRTQFQEMHPNITVEFEDVPAEEATDRLTTRIAGATRPTSPSSTRVRSSISPRAMRWSTSRPYADQSAAVEVDDYVPAFLNSSLWDGGAVRAADERRNDRPLLPHRPLRGGRDLRAPDDLGGVRGGRPGPDQHRQPHLRLHHVRYRGGLLLVPVAVAERRRARSRKTARRSRSTATPARRPPSSTCAWPITRRPTT